MRIERFVWPEERIEHIARHGVTLAEVEEACFGRPLALRDKSKGENRPGNDREGKTPLPKVERAMKKAKQLKTGSIQKLAEFWDTHDLTDFEDELKEVTEPVFDRDSAIKVPLESRDIAAVERLARSKGVSREQLVRSWVLQRITRRNNARPSKRSA